MMRRALVVLAMLVPALSGAQAPKEWRLVPVATVGGAEAPDERQLFDQVPVHGLVGRTNGHVLLLDVSGKRVLEYDATGRYVRTIGRGGGGPGEFEFPTGLAVGPGDSLWVFDGLRYSVFPLATGSPRTGTTSARTFGQLRADAQGPVQALSAVPSRTTGTGSVFPDHMRLARLDRRGAITDTIWTGPVPRRVSVTHQVGQRSHSTQAVEHFGTNTYWDMLPDGTLAVSDTSAYIIRIVSPRGQVVRTIGPGTAGRRVTPADRDRALAQIRAEMLARQKRIEDARFRLGPELMEKVLEATPFGAVVPIVSGVRVDRQGRIWVGVAGQGSALERIDIYDAGGTLLGRIMQPPAMPGALYGDGLMAFVDRDDSDAQRLRIMRVVE
jgi:hypothetical protein